MMPIEILTEGPYREIRAEDQHCVYIAKYDSYFKDTVVNMTVINKGSAQTITPTPDHYYRLGLLVGQARAEADKPEQGGKW